MRTEGCDVHRGGHRYITGMIGMKIVPGQLGHLAIGDKFGLHIAGGRIKCGSIEILYCVKRSREADECVYGLTVLINPRAVVDGCHLVRIPTLGRVHHAQRRSERAGRERAFIQRSFSFKVVWVPSVMESPNAHITTVLLGAMTSTPSRKNHEVVVNS